MLVTVDAGVTSELPGMLVPVGTSVVLILDGPGLLLLCTSVNASEDATIEVTAIESVLNGSIAVLIEDVGLSQIVVILVNVLTEFVENVLTVEWTSVTVLSTEVGIVVRRIEIVGGEEFGLVRWVRLLEVVDGDIEVVGETSSFADGGGAVPWFLGRSFSAIPVARPTTTTQTIVATKKKSRHLRSSAVVGSSAFCWRRSLEEGVLERTSTGRGHSCSSHCTGPGSLRHSEDRGGCEPRGFGVSGQSKALVDMSQAHTENDTCKDKSIAAMGLLCKL